MIATDVEKILVSEQEIIDRCVSLGKELDEYYAQTGDVPIVVGLLNGSVPFMAELIKRLTMPIEIDFMKVSSYDGTESIGDIRIEQDLRQSCKDKAILLVEDIVDTGRTLVEVKKMFLNKGAKDVKIVALLDKPERREFDIQADFLGFTIPNAFVVGYGLDYNQRYRNLPFVGVLKSEIYE